MSADRDGTGTGAGAGAAEAAGTSDVPGASGLTEPSGVAGPPGVPNGPVMPIPSGAAGPCGVTDAATAPDAPDAPKPPGPSEPRGVADVPAVPDAPSASGPLDVPDAPAVPESPGIPDTPEAPRAPDPPDVPEPPDAPSAPRVPDRPDPPGKPGPPRPAGHKAITDAARREFAEHGYSAASIRSIAQRAGVSLSALYYYYKGKQELLVAILDEGLDAYFTTCRAALDRAGDTPAERLEALVAATVRFRTEHPVKSNIVLMEARSLDPAYVQRYRETEARGSRQFRDVIEAGLADGSFHTPYPDDARRAVIAMCNAVAQWYDPDGPLTPGELVERYMALALTLVQHDPPADTPESRTI